MKNVNRLTTFSYIILVITLLLTGCNPFQKNIDGSQLDSEFDPNYKNAIPVAFSANLVVNPGGTLSGLLQAKDTNRNDKLVFSIKNNPSKGYLALTNANKGEYTYSAFSNSTGLDSFEFSVTDGKATSSAQVNISIEDNVAPGAPGLYLISNNRTGSALIQLGVTCSSDYAAIYFSESTTTPTANAAGWESCSLVMNKNLSSGVGLKSLNVWSKDSAGNVSTSYNSVSVYLLPIANMAATTLSKLESDGNVNVTVNLSAASTQTITIPLGYTGTSTIGIDYTAPTSVVFSPGETSKTIPITLINDTTVEGDETIGVILGNSDEHIVGNTDMTTVTVTDNDYPVVTANDLSVTEGTVAEVIVSVPTVAYYPITFNYTTQDSTALAGTDYVAQSGTATIAAGESSTKIYITTFYDLVTPASSATRVFKVNLSSLTNADPLSVTTSNVTIDKSAFYAPLRTSTIPTRGGVSATFTRADASNYIATVTDWEGLIKPTLKNEARFTGARRVENLLQFSETLTNAAWTLTNTSGGASRTAQQVVLGANTADKLKQAKTFSVGQTLVYSITVSGSGSFNMILYKGDGTTLTSRTIALSGTQTRYSVIGTNTTAGATGGVGIVSVGTAATVNVHNIQLENVHGQSNQNASEYISCGVLAAPYHGAGGADCVKYFDYKNGNTTDAGGVVTYSAGLATKLPLTVNLISNSKANPTSTANSTLTSGLSNAPDGTATAKKINVDNGSSGLESISYSFTGLTAGQSYNASIYVKADTVSTLSLGIYNIVGGTWEAISDFNLSTKTVTTRSGTVQRGVIVNVGNGWYRISLAAAVTNTTAAVYLYPNFYQTQSANNSIYFWGPQFEVGQSSNPYYATSGSSPLYSLKGLLSENTRTNKILYSEDLTNAAWVKSNVTITSNVGSIVAPDGLTNADKIVEDSTANSIHRIAESVTKPASAGSWIFSIYLKAAEKNKVSLQLANGAESGAVTATFDLSNGIISSGPTASGTGYSFQANLSSITPVGNGWYRCALSVSADADVTIKPIIQLLDSTGTATTYSGDGTSGLYAWGAQLENAAFYASYIATTSAPVSRGVDGLTYPFSIISNNNGSVQATVQLVGPTGIGSTSYFIASDANSRYAYLTANQISNITIMDGGGTVIATSGGASASKAQVRFTNRWSTTNIYAQWEDVAIKTPSVRTNAFTSSNGLVGIGNFQTGGSNPLANIRDVHFWNRTLGDAEVYLPGFPY